MCHRFLTAFLSFPPLLTAFSYIVPRGSYLFARPNFHVTLVLFSFAAEQNGFTYTLVPYPNPNHNQNPEAIHNPNG